MKFRNVGFGILSVFLVQTSAFAIPSDIHNGLKHMKAKSFSIASQFFHKAASEDPDNAIARYHLANAYVHLNKHEKKSYEGV